MGYYMGDYYARGDYYRRGDPGFLSFLGGVAKAGLGFIPGIGPALASGVGSLMEKKAAPAAAGLATSIAKPGFFKGATSTLKTAALKHPVLTGAGAAGIVGAGAGVAATKLAEHLKGHKRRRRMRATNPKALRRALRRAYAFERVAMRTIKLVHPRKHGRFGGFKKPKRRVC